MLIRLKDVTFKPPKSSCNLKKNIWGLIQLAFRSLDLVYLLKPGVDKLKLLEDN